MCRAFQLWAQRHGTRTGVCLSAHHPAQLHTLPTLFCCALCWWGGTFIERFIGEEVEMIGAMGRWLVRRVDVGQVVLEYWWYSFEPVEDEM